MREGAMVRQKLWGWMPGGDAEDVPVCLVLGTANVTAIEKKKMKLTETGAQQFVVQLSVRLTSF